MFRGSYEVKFEDKESAVIFENMPELRFEKENVKNRIAICM